MIVMRHRMRLHNGPFMRIKNGTKTIEMRLNDEKRQLIKVGDIIEFQNRITLEIINAVVTNLYIFNSFSELYEHFDKVSIGYDRNDFANPDDMEQYYSKEEQDKYGVLAIEVNLC